MELSQDDVIRSDVIFNIICLHNLDFKKIEAKYGIEFRSYFREDFPLIDEPAEDGFVEVGDDYIQLTPLGKIFAHHIARPFDKYSKDGKEYLRTHAAIMKEQKVAV